MARPKEFDPDEALDLAMHQFWSKGYHESSIRDLVAATGVNYYGLYDVFDSKHGLFLASLDRYQATVTADLIRALKEPGPLLPTLEAAIGCLITRMQTAHGRIGCLMCNTAVAVAPDDPAAAAKVESNRKSLETAFKARLKAAQQAGDLRPEADPKALAEFLTSTVYSLGLLLRAGRSDAYLRRHLQTALSTLG